MWSLHLPVEPHCPRCCPASFAKPDPRRYGAWPSPSTQALWKSFRNDPDHRSDNSLKLTDLKSESVISFIPESRSDQFRNPDRDIFGIAITLPRNPQHIDRKSTRLNSSHRCISYAV